MGATKSPLRHLPNALTLLRLALAPVIAFAVWRSPAVEGWSIAAFGLFVLAALTDLFDGMAARAFDAHSKFGRLIDPIADKALVGLPLIALSAALLAQASSFAWIVALATAVIVVRDIAITILRMTSPDGEGVRVSVLAKWKTSVEMLALGAALLAAALPSLAPGISGAGWIAYAWVSLLALAALLSASTGLLYVTAMKRAASA